MKLRFLKPPFFRTCLQLEPKVAFHSSLKQSNFTLDFSNSSISAPIFVSIGGSKNRDSIVCSSAVFQAVSRRQLFCFLIVLVHSKMWVNIMFENNKTGQRNWNSFLQPTCITCHEEEKLQLAFVAEECK